MQLTRLCLICCVAAATAMACGGGKRGGKGAGAGPTKADEARAWLRTVLPPGTAKPRDEILAAAQAAGFHEKTLYRVADGIAKDRTTGLWSNNQDMKIEHPILKFSPGNSQGSPGTEN